MRSILFVAGTAGLVGIFTACGGDDRPKPIGDGATANGGGSRPRPEPSEGGETTGGAGGEATDSPSNPLAPHVTLTSPAPAPEPKDGVLTESVVGAVCVVEQSPLSGSAAVDPSSVEIALIGNDDEEIERKPATMTANDEFRADFVLTTVPSGRVKFKCTAKDVNDLEGWHEVRTFVDHGPTITIASPKPDKAYPIKGGLDVEFSVAPTELIADDDEAEVDAVTFTLDGKPYSVVEGPSGKFKTNLPLDNPEKFPQIPTGAVSISASNKRAPKPVTAVESYSIKLDGLGPTISIDSPPPQDVVGGKLTVVMTIKDDSAGVDAKSVSVSRFSSDTRHFFDPDNGWSRTGDTFKYTFDTKEVERFEKVQATIDVRARDSVGNQSATGQSVQIYLDNVSPEVDLDPRNIRLNQNGICTRSFDPVGDAALNDLQGVFGDAAQPAYGFLRAFVYERTNSVPGQALHYPAGTDQSQVRLYYQANPANAAIPLLVNKNPKDDGTCDDVGGLDDSVNAPKLTKLTGLGDGQGQPWNEQDEAAEPPPVNCSLFDGSEPQHMCPAHSSDMYDIPYNDTDDEPLVYVVGTPKTTDESCVGIDMSLLSDDQEDGWVCAVARAVDHAGNVGISPPLRICVDDPLRPGVPSCAKMSVEPPSCTDGCVPPARGGNLIIVEK